MDIDINRIIVDARASYESDANNDLTHYVIIESLRSSFNANFNDTFTDYSQFNSFPEITSFTTKDVITGKIGIKNMFYGDFEEEYELYDLMNKAENWVNMNIDKLLSLIEKQDLMLLVDDQDENTVSSL